jgi:hypothetical protein
MNIIPLPNPPPPSPAQRSALNILAHINSASGQAVQRHIELFKSFWDAPSTPDEILEQIGTNASRMLAAASESAEHLQSLAVIAGVELSELIPLEFIIPRRAFAIASDGSATLLPPADGHDAWGRLIPEPEPEPGPEPEDGVSEGDMPDEPEPPLNDD